MDKFKKQAEVTKIIKEHPQLGWLVLEHLNEFNIISVIPLIESKKIKNDFEDIIFSEYMFISGSVINFV
ncbi:MAG: hypothetical protein KBD37_01730 [Burkholderiales bacterium]|nr:hypothetical protein [Burkholderiales bacterium]